MDIWEVIILSIIQGLTEFLPISSSAHLILVSELIRGKEEIIFDVAVHLGSLLAAIVYFRKDLLSMILNLSLHDLQSHKNRELINLLIALFPILICGFFLRNFVEGYLRTVQVITYATIFFAFILYFATRIPSKIKDLNTITHKQAFIIGLAQCLALIPGSSRSGVTISAALFLGIDKDTAAKFSFLLAIPTIGAIAFSELINLNSFQFSQLSFELGLGCFISFIIAYLTIDLFLKLIKRFSLTPFVIYRILLGIFLLYFWA